MHHHNALRLSLYSSRRLAHTNPTFNNYRHFHASPRKLQAEFPNHYETLGLSSTATAKEIKGAFYSLSKRYHPDKNPNDASASQRFVKISEAYHTLGSAEKKGKYDRDYQRVYATYNAAAPGGSYSSASMRSGGPAGGRPASGLSKRRTQFRGPPPSFYQQGEYGRTGTKRQAAQDEAEARTQSSTHPGGLGANPDFSGTGGFSPGSESGFYPDPELHYFDKASHRRTHDNLGARRGRMQDAYARTSDAGGPGALANALMVGGVMSLGVIGGMTILNAFHVPQQSNAKLKKNRENG